MNYSPDSDAGANPDEARSRLVVKRSIAIGDRRTSVSLEEPFWLALKDIAAARGDTLSAFVAEIDALRQGANLSSTLRVFVLQHFVARADEVAIAGTALVAPAVALDAPTAE